MADLYPLISDTGTLLRVGGEAPPIVRQSLPVVLI